MTIFTGYSDHQESQRPPDAPAPGSVSTGAELPELLSRFRELLDEVRSSGGPAASGPADLALTVVDEALAIGEAMSRIAVDCSSDEFDSRQSAAIYAEIDSRFVEHRTRALRSALHGVDDYVWWGGLATAAG